MKALSLRQLCKTYNNGVQALKGIDLDVEEAAASLGASRFTTFRRIVLPSLTPAITAGAALSFARGVSEYGSLVLLSGNLPFKTEATLPTREPLSHSWPAARRRGGRCAP